MSCWDDIDRLKARHAEELRQTTNSLEALRAIKCSVETNEFGPWQCRYIPKGERKQETLTARTGGGFVEKLTAVRAAEEKPKPKLAAL